MRWRRRRRVDGPGRVFLHVGAPKTGTTFVQNVLWRNREALAEAGVCYPLTRPGEHFPAALDLREMPWAGRRDPAWDGAWQRVATRAGTSSAPTVIISNEILGGASPAQVSRAVASLEPREIHVVFTARDLARQLPSDWQEHLKNRHRVGFATFVADLVELGRDAPAPFGELFWGLHDPVDVLSRWQTAVPAERIHLVTVPPSGAGRGLLWERFAGVVGLDPAAFDTEVARTNTSLGVTQAELLRRLNVALQGRFPHVHYDPLVRVRLAESVLVAQDGEDPAGGQRLRLPAERLEWARQRTAQLVAGVRAAGWEVVGDLAELTPTEGDDGPSVQPEDVDEAALFPIALEALCGLLQHMGRMRERLVDAERQVTTWQREPVRQWVRDRSEHNRLVRVLRRAYWRLANARPGRRGAGGEVG